MARWWERDKLKEAEDFLLGPMSPNIAGKEVILLKGKNSGCRGVVMYRQQDQYDWWTIRLYPSKGKFHRTVIMKEDNFKILEGK